MSLDPISDKQPQGQTNQQVIDNLLQVWEAEASELRKTEGQMPQRYFYLQDKIVTANEIKAALTKNAREMATVDPNDETAEETIARMRDVVDHVAHSIRWTSLNRPSMDRVFGLADIGAAFQKNDFGEKLFNVLIAGKPLDDGAYDNSPLSWMAALVSDLRNRVDEEPAFRELWETDDPEASYEALQTSETLVQNLRTLLVAEIKRRLQIK